MNNSTETLQAKIRNLLTPYCNILSLHKHEINIPEETWEMADENFKRILNLLKDSEIPEKSNYAEEAAKADIVKHEIESSTCTPTNSEIEIKLETPIDDLVRKYMKQFPYTPLTFQQLKWIEQGLRCYNPRQDTIFDIKYDRPSELFGCIVISSDYHKRTDIVQENYGHYDPVNKQWYFESFRDGNFYESKPLDNSRVIGYIDLRRNKNERK